MLAVRFTKGELDLREPSKPAKRRRMRIQTPKSDLRINTDCKIRRLTCRLTCRLTGRLTCRLTGRLTCQLSCRLTRWLSCWLTCQLACRLTNFFLVIFDLKNLQYIYALKQPNRPFCVKRTKVRSESNFFSQSDLLTKGNSNRGKAEVINRRFPVDWRTFQLLDFCVSRCKPKKVFLTKNRRNFGGFI